MRTLVFACFCILGLNNAISQNNSESPYFIETNYQYGFIWQHKPSLESILGGNINVVQLNLGKETYGKSYWDQLYRYPDWGGGVYFANLGNQEELGYASAIYAYVNVPLISRNKFELRYSVSGGLAYLTKGNIAVGTHVNLYFDANINARIFLTDRLYLINAFGATHFSNGATKMPNLGLNLFAYRLGFHYSLADVQPSKVTKQLPQNTKKNWFNMIINAGLKEAKFNPGTKYSVLSFSANYLRSFGYKHKIGVGFDYFYDESIYRLMNSDIASSYSRSETFRYGIHLATEYRINKICLDVQLGTYLYSRYEDDGLFYERVGIRYLIYKDLFLGVSLKANNEVADFIEWGVGYQFPW